MAPAALADDHPGTASGHQSHEPHEPRPEPLAVAGGAGARGGGAPRPGDLPEVVPAPPARTVSPPQPAGTNGEERGIRAIELPAGPDRGCGGRGQLELD